MSGSLQPLVGYGAAAYKIANSLRFRSSASAYLSRTPSVAGNQKTWTYSIWVKPAKTDGDKNLLRGYTNGGNIFTFNFSSEKLFFDCYIGWALQGTLTTTQVFRDFSAWYHIQLVMDTTQATASNRTRLYVNGSQVTSFSSSTYPAQNADMFINSTTLHNIGGTPAYPAQYFDGYLAEVNFIDGQALDPTSFGAFDATTGVWTPKSYAGAYGTNGFYLKFSNGTSTTTLGYDSSGNGNNWTTNNISLTAGSTYDWMIDSPTSYQGTSYGVGNYCVCNPLDTSGATINANLSVNTVGYSGYGTTRATFGMSSGKWYWEVTPTSFGDGGIIGISTASASITQSLGANVYGWGYLDGGSKYNNASATAYGASYTTNDVIGVAFDADAGTLTFYKNNASQGVAFSGLTSGPYFPTISDNGGGSTGSVFAVTFGQRPFAYTPPSGFKSLCTYNLPTPSIQNGAGYMAATIYTANGGVQPISNAVNGITFQPDFVWIKSRSAAASHTLFDSIRGAANYLVSNTTNPEASAPTYMTSFDSGGFSMGSGNDPNGRTMVGWQWKAGGTAVTNTAGSITSQVSANTTAGFSVVTYTGNGVATASVGHGLGVVPSLFIFKGRSNANSWIVGATAIGTGNYLVLNASDAVASGGWNSTAPTSSVITLGSGNPNYSGQTFVAYCFAAIPGYSAFGSYTGNGSADGPFVYCGFRPRYVLIKASSAAYNWHIFDSSRDPYNVAGLDLSPNLSSAEANNSPIVDLLSNGFKLRTAAAGWNDGNTYIYAAFAENPFTNALAR